MPNSPGQRVSQTGFVRLFTYLSTPGSLLRWDGIEIFIGPSGAIAVHSGLERNTPMQMGFNLRLQAVGREYRHGHNWAWPTEVE